MPMNEIQIHVTVRSALIMSTNYLEALYCSDKKGSPKS